MKNILRIFAFLLLSIQGIFAQTSSEIKMTIDTNSKAMQEAIKNGDLQTFADYYAEDAMLKISGHPEITGRDAIMKSHKELTDQKMEMNIESQEMYSGDGYVTELGKYQILSPDGQMVDDGTYMTLWKKIDGKWLIYRDVVSSSNQNGK